MNDILWSPSENRRKSSLINKFMEKSSQDFKDYFSLHSWSINNMEDFWEEFWNFSGIIHSKAYDSVLTNPVMPGAKWFEGAELNYAENLLSGESNQTAIVSVAEGREDKFYTFAELNSAVASAQKGLENLGVKEGQELQLLFLTVLKQLF